MDLKQDFPFFSANPHCTYLDSAATAQVPLSVVEAIQEYYTTTKSNIDGLYPTAIKNVQILANARTQLLRLLFADQENLRLVFSPSLSILTNQLALSLLNTVKNGSIIVSPQDHHSGYLPFTHLDRYAPVTIIQVPLDNEGLYDVHHLENMQEDLQKVRLVVLNRVSHVLGSINPTKQLVHIIRKYAPECKVLMDVSQSIAHEDTSEYFEYCDGVFFSSHKLYGPFGVGCLVCKEDFLSHLSPAFVGGKMVQTVNKCLEIVAATNEQGFELGTPNIADIYGFCAAAEYYQAHKDYHQEKLLLDSLISGLQAIPNISILAPSAHKLSLVSFTHSQYSSYDIAAMLAKQSVAVRSGTHCAQPLFSALQLDGSVRVSIGMYTDGKDIQMFFQALQATLHFLE